MDRCPISLAFPAGNMQGEMRHGCSFFDGTTRCRPAFLLTVAVALWAMAPAAAAQGGSEARAGGDKSDVVDSRFTEPTPPAAPQQQAPAQPSAPPDQTSTSPGGQSPGSGTSTTGPGAPATDGGELAACDPRAAVRGALRQLRRAARGRNVLARRARAFTVRVEPCAPGTFELTISHAGVVLWRARRELRTTVPARLRVTLTRAGRRFVTRRRRGPSRRVMLRVRASYAPASSNASTSPSTS